MKRESQWTSLAALAAIVLAGASPIHGQQLPSLEGVFGQGDGVVYGPMEGGRRSNPHAPHAEIVEVTRWANGSDIMIAGEPSQLLTVWACDDFASWEYVACAAEIEAGLYLAHDEDGVQSTSRFYLVVKPRGLKPCNPAQHAQNLVGSVANWEWLNAGQRQRVVDAAERVAAAYARYNQKSNELNRCLRLLADCLKEVARLRLEAQLAEEVAADAERAASDAEAAAQAARDKLADLNKSLAEEEARRDRWVRDMDLLDKSIKEQEARLSFTTGAQARGDILRVIAGLRQGFQERLGRYNESTAKIAELKNQVAAQEGPIEAAEAAAATASAHAEAGRATADAARRAYEDARRRCEETKNEVKSKEAQVHQAEDEIDDAARDFGDAQQEAAEEGAAAREAAAEAAARAEEEKRLAQEAAEQRERERAAAQQAEYRRFINDLIGFVGEERARQLGGILFGPLTHGSAGAVKAGAAGTLLGQGTATSMLQAGWALIVKWAQAAAEGATKNLTWKRGAELAARHWVDQLGRNPAPGTFKHSNLKNARGEVSQTYFMVANADGSVTVYSYTDQTGDQLHVCVVKP